MVIFSIKIFSQSQLIRERASPDSLVQITSLLNTLKIERIIFIGNLSENLLHASVKIVGLVPILNRVATDPFGIFVQPLFVHSVDRVALKRALFFLLSP